MISKVAIFTPENGQFVISDNKINYNEIGPTDVLIRHTVIAINEIDVADGTIRKLSNLGYTACGEVIQCGNQVNWLQTGDRVVYFSVIGAYCQYKIIDQSKLIKVPSNISSNVATGVIYRGIIAHMIAVRTFIVREGIIALIDDIHTATASIIAWMIKRRGGYVVGITSRSTKIPSSVCDVIINRDSKTLVQDVINGCKGIGAHLYIPGLHGTQIDQVIKMLTKSAVIVDHIGSIIDLSVSQLMLKSLFLTAPMISDYKSLKNELILSFDEVIGMLRSTPLETSFIEYNFNQINEAFSEVSTAKSSDIIVIKM